MWISTLSCPMCEKKFETRQKVMRHVLYDASVCRRVMQTWQEDRRMAPLTVGDLEHMRLEDRRSANA
eukprot:11146556-Prorocentrum_lima.AAC.1